MPSFRVVMLAQGGERRETTVPAATGAQAMARVLGWKSQRESSVYVCYCLPADEPTPNDERRVIEAANRMHYRGRDG